MILILAIWSDISVWFHIYLTLTSLNGFIGFRGDEERIAEEGVVKEEAKVCEDGARRVLLSGDKRRTI